ncbi:Zinc finger, GRF-type [Sesbania bispinosa]|nr:Zinc finger, GRF-type [Sesbania bispinosa]
MMGSASSNPQFLQQRRSTTLTRSSSASSMANAAETMRFKALHCHGGRRAIIRVSKTDRNPGRPFYSCSLPKIKSVMVWLMMERQGKIYGGCA